MTFQEPSAEFPRVLVVAHNPFNRAFSNSLTLSSLFEGWPHDRISQIYIPFATKISPEFDVCSTYWALSPVGLAKSAPQNCARASGTPPSEVRPSATRRLVQWMAEQPRIRSLSLPVRELLYSQAGTRGGAGWSEVDARAPEVLFTTLGSLSCARLVLRLSDRLGIPVVPFVTDDWVRTEYHGVPRGAAMRRELEALLREILRRSPRSFAISTLMADEYEHRYGQPFETLGRCVDPDLFDPSPTPDSPTVELVYAGQIGLDRWRVLRRVGESLDALRADGVTGRLTVYTPHIHIDLYAARFARLPTVRLREAVPNAQLPAIYREADILVHVESADPARAAYTRLSVSTKIPEYLMAGRPVLGVGPPDLASMQHLATSGAAVVASEGGLTVALNRLLSDSALRATLGTQGRLFAARVHEGSRQRTRLRRVLSEAVRLGPSH